MLSFFFHSKRLCHLVYMLDEGPRSAPYRAKLLDLYVCQRLFYIMLYVSLAAGCLNTFDDNLNTAIVGAPLG
jgi:hypothetical protein